MGKWHRAPRGWSEKHWDYPSDDGAMGGKVHKKGQIVGPLMERGGGGG